MRFGILGPLEATDEQGRQVALGGLKQRAVLAILLLRANEVVSSERLIDELWSGEPPTTAAKSLQVHVSRLRSALANGGPDRDERIATASGGYRLRVAPGELDRDRFESLLANGLAALEAGTWKVASQRFREALGLWRGRPLSDFEYESFAQAEIARLSELHVAAAERWIEAELALGHETPVIGDLERLVREHPYHERLCSQLMLALYRAGRQADALAAYRDTRSVLVDELGIEPSAELRQLHEAILAQDRSLLAVDNDRVASPERPGSGGSPPVRPPWPTNLPVQPTPLFGRGTELSELLELAHTHRLLTLTGPGGIGKTRLTVALAAELSDRFVDGVWWVALAAVVDPALILPTVAQTIGAGDDLHAHLHGQRVLVVLDNFEQLLGAAPSIADLVAALPDLHVIVTSRERLALSAEQEYPVPPLAELPAVELFAARARQLKPDFQPDEAVSAICRRLDGLPLALELASTRVKVMTTDQILSRLERRLDLLTGGMRDAPARQATMRTAISWSHDLLTEPEQVLFRRIAVFAGSFDLETAEAVCDASIDTLQSLVDKSLLRQGAAGRFLLLETTREFALDQLEAAGEAADARRRHAEWFFGLVESAAPHVHSREQRLWLSRLHAETDNIRAVLAWSLEHDVARGIVLVTTLVRAWTMRGQLHELSSWLDMALADPGAISAPARALGLRTHGDVLGFMDQIERSEQVLQESARSYRDLGDKLGQASVLNMLGLAYWQRGDGGQAVAAYRAALEMFQAAGDRAGTARSLHVIGDSLRDAGDLEAGRTMLEQALALETELGDDYSAVRSAHSLGDLALDEGRRGHAESLYRRCLRTVAEDDDERAQAYCIAGLACVRALHGDPHAAGRLWGIVQSVEDRLGFRILAVERNRYERVLTPLNTDARFVAGLQVGNDADLHRTVQEILAHDAPAGSTAGP
jgi:predicted ATPase/DNA-binding SARP family transcriptional activator